MFEFTKSIVVDGKLHLAGDRVNRDQIPAGSFASLTRLRQLVPCDESPAQVFAETMEQSSRPADVPVIVEAKPDPEPTPASPLVGPPGDPNPEPKPDTRPEPKRKK